MEAKMNKFTVSIIRFAIGIAAVVIVIALSYMFVLNVLQVYR